MNIEEFREHCLSVKGATESLPFLNHNILVVKIMGKMFAYIPLEPKEYSNIQWELSIKIVDLIKEYFNNSLE